MIKSIEIKNFESHEHTILSDFSSGLNLIRGESNCGKTAIVRALKLVAYNEYDPKSLRIGASECEVIVKTDKGMVKVIRGPKTNLWEVTPLGKPTISFDKVGVKIVPEAARILGLNMVKLGDADIPVNIMDQLESHFMLASVGGKDVSGSLRAQVIDEISGLSGIEGVIKAVSLDNHRFGREISENEEKMKEAHKQLHDQEELDKESKILESAELSITTYEQCMIASEDAQSLVENHNTTSKNVKYAEDVLSSIPDFETAKVCLDSSRDLLVKSSKAEEINKTSLATTQKVDQIELRLGSIPDVDQASSLVEDAKQIIQVSSKMETNLKEHQRISERVVVLESNLNSLPKTDEAIVLIENAKQKVQGAGIMQSRLDGYGAISDKTQELIEKMGSYSEEDPLIYLKASQNALETSQRLEGVLSGIRSVQGQIGALEDRLEANGRVLTEAESNRDTILASVKVCPLTLKPVSKQCLEDLR